MSGQTRTFKFLAAGARGPISGFAWPVPASSANWIEVAGALLPYWLHDELWETEIDGEQVAGIDCLVVRRARLLRRIEGWHDDGARSFVEACAQHAAESLAHASPGARALAQGYVDDARECADAGMFALAAFSAAIAVGRLADAQRAEHAYRSERAWQADWLVRCVIADS
jgi:hypothetical protein